jgi:hypothetical protein
LLLVPQKKDKELATMDQKNGQSNPTSGNVQGNRRMATSFHTGTHLTLPFYGQSTDSAVVYALTLVLFFLLACWNRYLAVIRNRLENRIITARALEALGKPHLSPLPRLVRVTRGNHPGADDESIEMQAHDNELLRGRDPSSDIPAPVEATQPKSVSYYIWMRAFVELFRALLAFVL